MHTILPAIRTEVVRDNHGLHHIAESDRNAEGSEDVKCPFCAVDTDILVPAV
jgi:hypothetical protein